MTALSPPSGELTSLSNDSGTPATSNCMAMLGANRGPPDSLTPEISSRNRPNETAVRRSELRRESDVVSLQSHVRPSKFAAVALAQCGVPRLTILIAGQESALERLSKRRCGAVLIREHQFTNVSGQREPQRRVERRDGVLCGRVVAGRDQIVRR